MVLGKEIQAIPTIGFNVDSFELNGLKFVAWDVGGRGRVSNNYSDGHDMVALTFVQQIRALHHHYYAGLEAVVYLVDAAYPEIIPEAVEEFQRMTKEPQLRDCVFMLLGNKQDLPHALSMRELESRFDIKSVKQTVYTQGLSVTSGDGVQEAFHWLAEQLKRGKPSRWATMRDTLAKYVPFAQCTAPPEQIVDE